MCCVDDVEKVIGLLLRETGDKLNEEVRNLNVCEAPGSCGKIFVKV